MTGWNRLAIAVALLWLAGTVALSAGDFPTRERMRAEQATQNESALYLVDPKRIGEACRRDFANSMVDFDNCLTKRGYTDAIVIFQKERASLYAANAQYENENLLSIQVRAIFVATAVWIGPLFALYCLVATILWVRRGFQRQS